MKRVNVCTFVFLIIVVSLSFSVGEIHRAKTFKHKVPFSQRTKARQSAEYSKSPPGDSFIQEPRHTVHTWICTLTAATAVGLAGICPLIFLWIYGGKHASEGNSDSGRSLNLLLSFAVGGLLGDVFLHLLPEAWVHLDKHGHDHWGHIWVGGWVLGGLLFFLIIEKAFPDSEADSEAKGHETLTSSSTSPISETTPSLHSNGIVSHSNGTHVSSKDKHAHSNGVESTLRRRATHDTADSEPVTNGNVVMTHTDTVSGLLHRIKTSGWLNLFANFIDNFTHGLAVGGSFVVGTTTGLTTTAAILLHEVPHEIGDFGILLSSGFSPLQAAKAQLLTASGVLLGALVALLADSAAEAGDYTAWILPFSSGGFLYIALVTVVPSLLKETSGRESFKQVVMLLLGVASMKLVTCVHA